MFTTVRTKEIANLKATYEEYEHPCGAKHIHLTTDNTENCFVVAFATLPEASDGRAHILEHLALCGSKKYSARAPFFSMNKRSMASFMNAMTYSDKTAYPFATTDTKDYYNLLSVYLDAAFFPKLNYMDFRQEGWRFEEDEKGRVNYQGVVFNEMKGAFDSRSRHVWHACESTLKEGTTYENESGGDPLQIPNLSYEELVEFHRTHYHPSRAIFLTFGNIPAKDIQSYIESEVLSKFAPDDVLAPLRPHTATPKEQVQERTFAVPSVGESENDFAIQMSWILGPIDHSDIDDYQLFEQLMLADGGPISNALQNTPFESRPSELMGLATHTYEATLHLGLEGLAKSDMPAARQYLDKALEQVAKNGVPAQVIDAKLRTMELSIKEISGSNYPFGISVLLNALPRAIAGTDALAAIDLEPRIAAMRARFEDPNYVKELANRLRGHYPMLVGKFEPQKDFFQLRQEIETKRLDAINAQLTDEERQSIRRESALLKEQQNAPNDVSALPQIRPSDVSKEGPTTLSLGLDKTGLGPKIIQANIAANGVSYLSMSFDCHKMPADKWIWAELLTNIITQMPTKTLDWQQASIQRGIHAPFLNTGFGTLPRIGQQDHLHVKFSISDKNLDRLADNSAHSIDALLKEVRLDDKERLAYLIGLHYDQTVQGVGESGNSFAMVGARSGMNASAQFDAKLNGFEALTGLARLKELSTTDEGLSTIVSELEAVRSFILSAPAVILAGGNEQTYKAAHTLSTLMQSTPAQEDIQVPAHQLPIDRTGGRLLALTAPGGINFNVMCMPTIDLMNPDSVYLGIFAKLLSQVELHKRLREQGGAYGGGASYDPLGGTFTFSTYRDPRFLDTYKDFDDALEFGKNLTIEPHELEQAKIALLSGLDKPQPPKAMASSAVQSAIIGMDDEFRNIRRAILLGATNEQVLNAAKKHLHTTHANRCSFISPELVPTAKEAGFEVVDLMGLISNSTPSRKGPKM